MSKLIVIEGLDASGKATQAELLHKYFLDENKKTLKIEFPDYESPSSSAVKMYLNGDFGKDASLISPYVASTFFAVDRFASFKTKWEKLYNEGFIIIADRYVTANMIHQASKIKDLKEKETFIEWLYDFEYNKFGLPTPDLKIFLDMPPDLSVSLMENRQNKFSGGDIKDIHERDIDYLKTTYKNAKFITEKYGFVTVNCVSDNKLKSIETIHKEIIKITKDRIK